MNAFYNDYYLFPNKTRMSTAFERLKLKYLEPARIKKAKPKPPKRIIKKENQLLPPADIVPTKDIPKPEQKSITDYRFGSHISIQKGYKGAAIYAKQLGFNCLQIFTQSPRTTKFKPFKEEEAKECKQYIKDNDIEMWIHCSYIINYCRKCCESTKYLRDCVVEDMKRATKLGAKGCVIHVGKLNGKEGAVSKEAGLLNFKHNVEKTIEQLLAEGETELPWLLIETAAGQGTETPVTVKGLSDLYFSINESYRKYVGFCIDTCHIFASGECDIRDTDETDNFINKWNEHIGWEHVKLIHFNDSKCDFESKKDRHAPIGQGKIGKKPLIYFRDFCILTGKSMVTE